MGPEVLALASLHILRGAGVCGNRRPVDVLPPLEPNKIFLYRRSHHLIRPLSLLLLRHVVGGRAGLPINDRQIGHHGIHILYVLRKSHRLSVKRSAIHDIVPEGHRVDRKIVSCLQLVRGQIRHPLEVSRLPVLEHELRRTCGAGTGCGALVDLADRQAVLPVLQHPDKPEPPVVAQLGLAYHVVGVVRQRDVDGRQEARLRPPLHPVADGRLGVLRTRD